MAGYLDEEDPDELDAAETLGAPQAVRGYIPPPLPPMAGTPAANANPQARSALYEALMAKAQGGGPDPYADLKSRSQDAEQDMLRNKFLSSLNQAGAAAGSLNGKQAQLAPSLAGDIYGAQKADIAQDYASRDREAKRQELYAGLAQKTQASDVRQQGLQAQHDMANKRFDLAQQGLQEHQRHNQAIEGNESVLKSGTWRIVPDLVDPSGAVYQTNTKTGEMRKAKLPTNLPPSAAPQAATAPGTSAGMPDQSAADDQSDRPLRKQEFSQINQIRKELQEGRASHGVDFGVQQNISSKADRVAAVGKQIATQKEGGTPQQMSELGAAVSAMIQGGNAPAISLVHDMVPDSMGREVAAMEQWLTNEPHGTNQQAFVKQMLDTAEREGHLAKEKVKGYKAQTLNYNSGLLKTIPNQQRRLYQEAGFGSDDQFDKNGLYVPKEYKPSVGSAPAPTMPTPEQARAILEQRRKAKEAQPGAMGP